MAEIEGTKLLKIVLDMLAENVPDQHIIITLQQSGVSEIKAKEVLEQAKKKFKMTVDSIIERKVDELTDKILREKMTAFSREMKLQQDLKLMEQKEYTDKSRAELEAELHSVESDVTSMKSSVGLKLREITKLADETRKSKPNQRNIGIGLLLIGILSIIGIFIYGFPILNYLIGRQALDTSIYLFIILVVAFIIVTILALNTGYKLLNPTRTTKTKSKPSPDSIRELAKEEDLV